MVLGGGCCGCQTSLDIDFLGDIGSDDPLALYFKAEPTTAVPYAGLEDWDCDYLLLNRNDDETELVTRCAVARIATLPPT